MSTLGFSRFASLIPRGEAGGYTALYYSLRAVASAIAVPVAGWTFAVSGSYRSLFLLGGTATLTALVPLAFAPSPAQEWTRRANCRKRALLLLCVQELERVRFALRAFLTRS